MVGGGADKHPQILATNRQAGLQKPTAIHAEYTYKYKMTSMVGVYRQTPPNIGVHSTQASFKKIIYFRKAIEVYTEHETNLKMT